MAANGEIDGALAEFASLRASIGDRIKAAHQFLALQLTLCGAIFAFAISQPAMIALLLVVPFTSYMLCGRHVAQYLGARLEAQYIREELSPRVPGGLGWEAWENEHRRDYEMLGSTVPLFITFVGSSLFASAWVGAFVWGHAVRAPSLQELALVLVWLAGLAAAALSTFLLVRIARKGIRGDERLRQGR
jgi:hypothetical protein